MTASFRGTETKRIAELWNCERRTTKLNTVTLRTVVVDLRIVVSAGPEILWQVS